MDTTVVATAEPLTTQYVLAPLVLHEVEVPSTEVDVLDPMTELVVERYVDVIVLEIVEVAMGVLAATAPDIKANNLKSSMLDCLSLCENIEEDSSSCTKRCERW